MTSDSVSSDGISASSSPTGRTTSVPSARGTRTASPCPPSMPSRALTVRTSLPTSSTTPMNSWPIRWPASLGSIFRYGQRSLPQMQARVIVRRASVDSTRRASGTSSTRTSPAPYITVARILRSFLVERKRNVSCAPTLRNGLDRSSAGCIAGAPLLREAARLRCLIVDDSEEFLASARRLLDSQGAEVVGCASSRTAALELAQALEPDVVLVDIVLGDEDGIALAQQLFARTPSTRIILISSYARDDLGELIADSPAVGFLPKSELGADAIARLLR